MSAIFTTDEQRAAVKSAVFEGYRIGLQTMRQCVKHLFPGDKPKQVARREDIDCMPDPIHPARLLDIQYGITEEPRAQVKAASAGNTIETAFLYMKVRKLLDTVGDSMSSGADLKTVTVLPELVRTVDALQRAAVQEFQFTAEREARRVAATVKP